MVGYHQAMFKKGRWPLNFACPKFNKGHFRTRPGSGSVFFIVFVMLRMYQLQWPRWQGCSASPAGGLRGFVATRQTNPLQLPGCFASHQGRETFSTQLHFHELLRVGLVASLQNQTNSAAAHFEASLSVLWS